MVRPPAIIRRAATGARARLPGRRESRYIANRQAVANAILNGPIVGGHQDPRTLQAFAWPVWRTPAMPWLAEEARVLPYRPVRTRDGRWHPGELARIVWRSILMAAWPCCLGQRYGHLFLGYRTIDTAGDAHVARSELVVARTRDGGLLVQTGPQPCPECGHPAPRHVRRQWERHVRTQR